MEPRDHVLEHKENVRPRGGGLRRNRAFTSLAGLLVVPVALQRSTKTRSTRPGRLGCRPRRLRTTEFALSSDIALPPHSDRLLGRTHKSSVDPVTAVFLFDRAGEDLTRTWKSLP